MKIGFGAGGSGGHIIPAIALARELQKQISAEIVFFGNSPSMEQHLAREYGYDFFSLKVQKLYRKLTLSHVKFPFLLMGSILTAYRYLKENKVDAIISTGGFVAAPVAIAALIAKIPLFNHESNSYPGLTNRCLARYAKVTYTAFDSTSRHIPNTLKLGIPILDEHEDFEPVSLNTIGLSTNKEKILILGGSQGSLKINEAVESCLNALLSQGFEVIWQAGQSTFQRFYDRHNGKPGVHIFSFSSQIRSFYRIATLAITRAGAMTITELESFKLPAILIPLPTASENHQYFNALEQQKKGIARLLPQAELSGGTLLAQITELRTNYRQYKANFASIQPNTAARDIVQSIMKILNQEAIKPKGSDQC